MIRVVAWDKKLGCTWTGMDSKAEYAHAFERRPGHPEHMIFIVCSSSYTTTAALEGEQARLQGPRPKGLPLCPECLRLIDA